jgi:hypothetical protein
MFMFSMFRRPLEKENKEMSIIVSANENYFVLRVTLGKAAPALNQVRQDILASATPVIAWQVTETGECMPLTLLPQQPPVENEITAILLPSRMIVSGDNLYKNIDEFAQFVGDRWNARAAQRRAA